MAVMSTTCTAGNIGGTGEYLMNKLDIPLEAQKSINFGRLVSGQDMDTNEVKQVHAVDTASSGDVHTVTAEQ